MRAFAQPAVHNLAGLGRFVPKPHDVAERRAVLVEIAHHLLAAWVGGLFDVGRDLHARLPRACLGVLHGGQLVDTVERGLVVRRDQAGAYPPRVDTRTLAFHVGNKVFIEVAGSDDKRVFQAGLGHSGVGDLAEFGQVAGIEPDGRPYVDALFAQFEEDADGVWNAAFHGVVGVDEQHALFRIEPGEGAEGVALVVETHHPAVRVRARDRHAVDLAGEHVGTRGAAPDVGGAGAAQRAVGTVGPAQSELHHRVPRGGQANAGGLGRNEGRVVEQIQQRALEHLGLEDAALNLHDGLVRKDDGALGHRAHAEARPVVAQVVEKLLVKSVERAQVVDIICREAQVFEVVEEGSKARGNGESGLRGQRTKEILEGGELVHAPFLEIAGHHGQFVQVREQGQPLAARPSGTAILRIVIIRHHYFNSWDTMRRMPACSISARAASTVESAMPMAPSSTRNVSNPASAASRAVFFTQ